MRYGTEVRFRFIGDQRECIQYIPRGRLILGELYNSDITLGGLEQSYRTVKLANGVVIAVWANQYLPEITIDASAAVPSKPPEPIYTLRLAWLPEGIVMTPVSDVYPDGLGLPSRTAAATDESPAGTVINPQYAGVEPEVLDELLANAGTILASPLGTDGGILPQVLLNRYANNRYLDKKEYISGLDAPVLESIVPENPRLRVNYEAPYYTSGWSFVEQWQLVYDPVICATPPDDDGTLYWQAATNSPLAQVPGVYTLSSSTLGGRDITTAVLLKAQFADHLYTPAIFEAESDQWYSHRPEEVLYDNNAYEGCFQETNRIRADVGEPPMYRQLRGIPSSARMAVDEVALSHKMLHNSDDFRYGYRTIGSRALNATGRSGVGENLLIENTYAIITEQSGRDLAIAWENSPPHYANQINETWGDPDFPGAEHHISNIFAMVSETVYEGEIDPIIGEVACQSFTKKEFWLPPTTNHHEGTYGVAGVFGSQQRLAREDLTSSPFVVYQSRMYYLPQFYGEATFLRMLGSTAYKATRDDGIEQLMLRAVVLVGDPDLLDETTGYVTIKVVTRPVRLMDEYSCDWDEEYSYTFNNNDGWFPYPQTVVEFSPDGSKFLLSMLKATHGYSEALDIDATDFNTDISATVQTRNTMVVHFVEYQGEVLGMSIEAVAAPLVFVNATTTNSGVSGSHENIYERSVNATTPVFAAYDEGGVIQYVYAQVQEHTYQRWRDGGGGDPETESYGYRVRNLIFPSGKTVPYMQMYMLDSETVDDVGELQVYAWPGDYSLGSFTRRIAHLDVIAEDIVYHHIVWKSYMDSSDGFFETVRNDGWDWLSIDLGYDDPATGQERHTQVLWTGEYKLWAYQQNLRLAGYTHVDSSNRPRTTHAWPMHVSIETPQGIYCMDQAPQSWWSDTDGNFLYYRKVFPTPYAQFEDPGNGQGDDSIGMYKGTTPIDTIYGRPPASNYYASVAPGLSGITGGDNTYGLWNPAVWGSLQTANIAPQMADDNNVRCKIVRYKDRIVVRVRTVRKPYAIPPTTQTTYVGVDAAYLDVPEELAVVLYTNFDLDEAVGMVDVKDIYPFGRV